MDQETIDKIHFPNSKLIRSIKLVNQFKHNPQEFTDATLVALACLTYFKPWLVVKQLFIGFKDKNSTMYGLPKDIVKIIGKYYIIANRSYHKPWPKVKQLFIGQKDPNSILSVLPKDVMKIIAKYVASYDVFKY